MKNALITLLLLVSWPLHAQQADVGLVSAVSGDVTYVSSPAPPARVQGFMRVREGDRFRLAAGAQIRIVYLNASRQERWEGAAEFRAGKEASVPIAGKPAEMTMLPDAVGQHMTRIPALVHNAQLGGIQLRGGIVHRPSVVEQEAVVRQARQTHDAMRTSMAPDDITPELYLYSVLSEYALYADMKAVVAEMLKRQPGNEEVMVLDKWVGSKLTGTAP